MNRRRDPYETLGLPNNASAEDVRDAYRRMAKTYHPDVSGSPQDSARFRAVTEAYETLCDEQWAGGGNRIEIHRPSASPTRRPRESFREMHDRNDWRRRERPDVELAAVISPREASTGGPQPVRVVVPVPCPECGGGFFSSWFCRTCAGTGEIGAEVDFVIDIPPAVSHGTTIRMPVEIAGRWWRGPLAVEVTFLIDHMRA